MASQPLRAAPVYVLPRITSFISYWHCITADACSDPKAETLQFMIYAHKTAPRISQHPKVVSLSTHFPWANPQPARGSPRDLQTPSLDDLVEANFTWTSDFLPADGSQVTTGGVFASIAPGRILHTPTSGIPTSLSYASEPIGSSIAFPIVSQPQDREIEQTTSNMSEMQPHSSLADRSNVNKLNFSQEQINTTQMDEGLPELSQNSYMLCHSGQPKRTYNIEGGDSAVRKSSQKDAKAGISRKRNRIAAAKTRRKRKHLREEIERYAIEAEQTNV